MRRLTGLLAALALVLGAAAAAYAEDGPAGTPTPPSKPGDPFNGATLPPGDVFIVTPSDGATELGDPADPEAVQSHLEADQNGTPGASPSGAPSAGSTTDPDGDGTPGTGATSGPGAVDPDPASTEGGDDSSGPAWWVLAVGAAAVLALAAAGWRYRRGRAPEEPAEEPAEEPETGPPGA